LTAAATLAVLVSCAGCASATSLTRESARGAGLWCKAQPDTAWKLALAHHVVGLSGRASIVPLALRDDGHSFFASIWSKRFSGVGLIDVRTDHVTPIRRFPKPATDQASGSFDGRWLVWDEYHSLWGSDDFTTYSWDSDTGEVRPIGSATPNPAGGVWSSPWRHPEARQGYATWTQGTGDDGIDEVHAVELESGQDRIVRHGHAAGSFLVDGGVVVWPESLKPGALTTMLAASSGSGESMAPPTVFRDARGIGWAATDGDRVLYPGINLTSLWWSPGLATPARRVFRGRFAHAVGVPVQIAGRYASFGVAPHTYLADTTSGRYVEIPGGGWGILDQKSFVYLPSSPKKANHPVLPVLFYRLSELPPIPPCR
jgi:hypothetical protein